MLRVRCSHTEFTEYTEFGSVGMAGMPYPPTSVNIRAIRGSPFSARRFRVFRAFCGNIFSPTDGTDLHRCLECAVLTRNARNSQNLAAWVWQGCHTLLICEHPCSSVGGSSLPEGSVCAFCGNIFSPTDFTDLHRCLECAVLTRNARNSQNLAAWVWQGCHTILICEHPCSSVGGSSLPEGSVCSVRSAGEHRSLVGALETSAPPTE